MPNYKLSQHNNASMRMGDNYIQSLVKAVMDGPRAQWKSTVFFITYDDCGCFYDHIAPPRGSGLGIRAPMVIVSPYAKGSYVDHTVASFDSMLAFVEKNWRLPPLSTRDVHAYDYCRSFTFTTLPCTGPAGGTTNTTDRAARFHVELHPSPVPAASLRYVRTHPPDPNDPT
jgi:phospholipase C